MACLSWIQTCNPKLQGFWLEGTLYVVGVSGKIHGCNEANKADYELVWYAIYYRLIYYLQQREESIYKYRLYSTPIRERRAKRIKLMIQAIKHPVM